jgi:hypothetical protein
VALSKKQRFDVFKRDAFICQYCGRSPPTVVLEVDHVTAVSKGGTDDSHNLLTSCFDCNRGKAAGSLAATPLNTKEKADLLAERMEQAKAYDRLLAKHRRQQDTAIANVVAIFEKAFPGSTLKDTARGSIRRFLERLPFIEVMDSMEKACSKISEREHAFRYFCGICWKKIKGPNGG